LAAVSRSPSHPLQTRMNPWSFSRCTDVLVHNAGHIAFGPAEAFTPEQFTAHRTQRRERPLLVLAHQPRIAGDIDRQNGRQSSLDPRFAHLVRPVPQGDLRLRHRGRIVKTTGDGLLAEFASVVDAVRCAVEEPGVRVTPMGTAGVRSFGIAELLRPYSNT
jgi:hypothetical protein